ncbi:DUF6090 family protein [Winogradskyella sp. PE311]|uniref:DUF6090 family protein n=1 Tax=Winogradskyella sp. PE311 TaxID=3366943 RepID=UPI00397FD663
MIKFFRKIRYNLMSENKTSKYFKYAIGEILLVVIGILLALQINNWNQKRLESQKEKVVLNQLRLDFKANDSIIKKGLNYFDKSFIYNTLILKNTGPNVTLPKDEISRDSLKRLVYPKVNLVNSSLNISSQQFDIITSENLKILLSKFPSIYTSYLEVEEEVKKLTIKQRVHFKNYVSVIENDKDFDQENFKSDMLSVFRDRDFQNTTVDKRWNLKNALSVLERIDKENNLILELIKTELNDD